MVGFSPYCYLPQERLSEDMYARYIVSYSQKGLEWIFKLRFFQDMKMERKKEPEWLFKDFQCKIKAVLKAVHHFPSHPL